MRVIPAIDLREGACARVLGQVPGNGVYSNDPLEQAIILREQGAEWIHITDLDGAFSGHLCNLRIIQQLADFADIKIQHYGGVRSLEHIKTLLDLGVSRVVLSAVVLRDEALTGEAIKQFGDRVAAGIDSRDGLVSLEGFGTATALPVEKLVARLKEQGMERFIFTDISRPASMKGPNYPGIEEIISASHMELMVAGGISDYESITKLKEMGVDAAIIGKAIYTGVLDLRKAIEAAE